MKRWLILFYLLIHLASAAQESKLHVQVCDANGGAPLPYAVIRSTDMKSGVFTNESGVADVSSIISDSIVITAVGYRSRKLAKGFAARECVLLEPAVANLDSITVKTQKIIGHLTAGIAGTKDGFSWGSAGFGDEFAQLITFHDSSKVHRIQKIQIAASRYNKDIPVILHVYSVGADGLPAAELLQERVLLKEKHFNRRKKKFEVALDKGVVIYEGECFVGIEWLPTAQQGQAQGSTALLLTDVLPNSYTFSRAYFYSGDKWTLPAKVPGQINPMNTMILVEADVLE